MGKHTLEKGVVMGFHGRGMGTRAPPLPGLNFFAALRMRSRHGGGRWVDGWVGVGSG